MIVDKEIEITVNNHNIGYYKSKGYNAIYREKMMVKVLDLTIGSHYKINVKCDICGYLNIIEYRQLKGKKDYLCNSCSSKNKKKVKLTDEQKLLMIEKMLKTRELKKLEDPNYGKSKIKKEKVVKEKIRKEKVKKTEGEINIIIKKRKKTKLEKYGDENFNNQEKKKNSLKEKYGSENYNNTKARKETLKEKYGNENFNNQEKKEETCLNKYGVRHTNQISDIMIKIQKSAFKLKFHEEMKLYYRGTYEKHFLDFCFLNNMTMYFSLAMVGSQQAINAIKNLTTSLCALCCLNSATPATNLDSPATPASDALATALASQGPTGYSLIDSTLELQPFTELALN